MWSWLEALVSGIVQPILAWFSAYRQGRLAERLGGVEKILEKERELQDALDRSRSDGDNFYLGSDGRVYRRPSGPASDAPDVPDSKPDSR